MRRSSALAAAAFLLAACAAPPPKPAPLPAPLVGTQWQWEATTTRVETIVATNPDQYTLNLSAHGTAAVRADCNRGVGSYLTRDKQLSFGTIATTRAACAPGSRADAFLKSLQAAATYFIDGNRLFIQLKGDGGTMRFTKAE